MSQLSTEVNSWQKSNILLKNITDFLLLCQTGNLKAIFFKWEIFFASDFLIRAVDI